MDPFCLKSYLLHLAELRSRRRLGTVPVDEEKRHRDSMYRDTQLQPEARVPRSETYMLQLNHE
jgi:hypothetical protein